MRHIRRLFAAALLVFSLGLGLAPALPVYADASTTAACDAISNNNGCTSTGPSIDHIIKVVINIFSFVIGIIAIIMIMTSGFRYVTAGGDSNKLGAAKSTLIYAIVGLVIAGFAQIIVQFVLNKIS
ncbi:MAG TPA: hypothetical protein VLE99_00590 [Candidatus Saccharimonadales bacterium]|nr:hypothetical protein [Candidatus Saccharimonadales bacterium]